MRLSAILLLAASISAFAQGLPTTKTRIAIAGDSTVQTYTDDRGICGWGQILTEWASPDTEVFNEARSGTSSKSFRDLGAWEKVLAHHPKIVFVQFGHNDCSKDPQRGTQPEQEFSANILAFINEAKLAGAIPVLVTPPTPRTFQAKDGVLITDVKPYADAMRTVGEREKVLVVDLFSKSFDYFSNLGPQASKPERLSEYRQLLKRVGCVRGFEHFKSNKGITFIASASGMVTGGTSKGYYFSKIAPAPMVEDLDSYRPGHNQSYEVYRHIEGDWYLVYEFEG